MNKFIISLVALSLNLAFSQDEIRPPTPSRIVGSKNLPIELNLLLDSLQRNADQSQERFNAMLSIILNIDSYAKVLSAEDIFLVGKIEIYKNLLKTSANNKNATLDQATIATLKAALIKAQDPFNLWFLKALLKDCENIMASKSFNDYSLQKNTNSTTSLDYKKMHKKIQILYRWISKLNPDSSDFDSLLRNELEKPMWTALNGVEHSFYLMASSTTFEPFKGLNKIPEQMKFFSIDKVSASAKSLKKEKNIDDILAPVISSETLPSSPNLPQPSKEDWLNEENTPSKLKNLPNPIEDGDWLEDF